MVRPIPRALRAALLSAGLALAPVAAQAERFINILTGGTSGVCCPIGVALSKVYGEGIAGARTQVQATKASVENLNLLQQGKGEFALTLGDSLKLAWEGDADAGFPAPLDKLRGIAAAYPNYIQIAASAGSGMASVADLKGKSLSVGAPKSGTELDARAILAALGMTCDDLGKTEYLPFAESVELMKNRQLDATLQSAGPGVASIKDLATSVPTVLVAIPPEVAEALGAPLRAATIPAGTYEGLTADVPTLAIGNFFVTHEGVDEETVYQMTKLLFENLPELVAAHQAARAISAEKALDGMPAPLHPGAERSWREVGPIK